MVDRLVEGFATPDDVVGSTLVANGPPRRRRRPQVVEEMVRPAGFEPTTYRFVARSGEGSEDNQDHPSTTKDDDSGDDEG